MDGTSYSRRAEGREYDPCWPGRRPQNSHTLSRGHRPDLPLQRSPSCIKVGATYKATDEKIAKVDGFISATNESADLRKATYEESEGWYAGITADMFG